MLRRLTLPPVIALAALSARGGDDDDASPEITVAPGPTDETVPLAAPGGDAGDGGGAAPPAGDDGVVPPAPFTHTIVAGDFLSGIASHYGIEIDDIVAVNGWDGRDHLLLPGDEILLPADAERPGPEGPVAGPADDGEICEAGFTDSVTIREGDTYETIADRAGVSVDDLLRSNWWWDDAAFPDQFRAGNYAIFPCRANWPANVEMQFGREVESCIADVTTSPRATYTIQEGDTPEILAQGWGISVERLADENAATSGYAAFAPGTEINICESYIYGWYVDDMVAGYEPDDSLPASVPPTPAPTTMAPTTVASPVAPTAPTDSTAPGESESTVPAG